MTPHTTVSSILRAEQALGMQLCHKETLDYGIAYTCERFSRLPDFSQFREVVIEDPADVSRAFKQAEQWFSDRGLICRRWTPADGAESTVSSEFLEGNGFRRSALTAFVLPQWPELETPEHVRILPARAMRSAIQRTVNETASKEIQNAGLVDLWAEAQVERLNDPSYDASVALIDQEPAGWYALHQVGDIGRIVAVEVSPRFAEQGVEAAMLAHCLALAHRLMPRIVCASVLEGDDRRRRWLQQAGFVADGEIVQFERVDPPDQTT